MKPYRFLSVRAVLAHALVFVAAAARAAVFSVTSSGDTFTVVRQIATDREEVCCRTVSLSAVQGIHFVPVLTNLTFDVGQMTQTVRIAEMASANISVTNRYQAGMFREYRFEVLDGDGTFLADATRQIDYGNSYRFLNNFTSRRVDNLVYFSVLSDGTGANAFSSSMNTSKYRDFKHSGSNGKWIKVTDAGYKQAVYTNSTSSFYSMTGVPREYLTAIQYKLYATICLRARDVDDGFHYIQVLADNDSTYDSNDSRETLGSLGVSVYKAVDELADPGTLKGDGTLLFFPHRYNYKNRNAELANIGNLPFSSFSEFSTNKVLIYDQAIKAENTANTSGSLVFSPSVENIHIRFDAGGDGSDTWEFKDLFVRMTLVDDEPPLVCDAFVAQGPNAKYNRTTITLLFNEIVKAPNVVLTTSWGEFVSQENASSYANAVSFVGYIDAEAGTSLSIQAISGAITDLNGNAMESLPAHIAQILETKTVGAFAPLPIVGGVAQITTLSDLFQYAEWLESNPRLSAVLTRDIYMNLSTVLPFKAMGGTLGFNGTFDGKGHAIRNIQNITPTLGYRGLFGIVGTGGVVKNVALLDANIARLDTTAFGGICGRNLGVVEGCWFKGVYHSGSNAGGSCGGIVGVNERRGIVRNCVAFNDRTSQIGDVIGTNRGTAENVWFLGAVDFTSGRVCYIANGGVTDGTQAWYQDIGRDDVPRYVGATVYKFGDSYVNAASPSMSLPFLAESAPNDGPAYLTGADSMVLANYAEWGERYGYDLDGTRKAAFLLNIDPAIPLSDNAALLKVVSISKTATNLRLELASDVAPLTQKAAQSGTSAICNGYLTLYVSQIPSNSASGLALGFPVSPGHDGHAIIDIDITALSPSLSASLSASSTFFRPAVTVEKPDPAR